MGGKLPDSLGTEDKARKIANLLTKLRRDGHIRNTGPAPTPSGWSTASRTRNSLAASSGWASVSVNT